MSTLILQNADDGLWYIFNDATKPTKKRPGKAVLQPIGFKTKLLALKSIKK